jgi:hypothetical protein
MIQRLMNPQLKSMNMLKTFVIAAAVAAITLPIIAQQKRISPHETVSAVIDGNRVTVTYGRPYSKDPRTGEIRRIWGNLVPFGKVWRTGADEATILITEKPLEIGRGTTVPAGAYSLYTLPQADGSAKLIINKEIGQWGMTYHEDRDLVRVELKREVITPPVDQLNIAVEKMSNDVGVLKITWSDVQYSVPFKIQK